MNWRLELGKNTSLRLKCKPCKRYRISHSTSLHITPLPPSHLPSPPGECQSQFSAVIPGVAAGGTERRAAAVGEGTGTTGGGASTGQGTNGGTDRGPVWRNCHTSR